MQREAEAVFGGDAALEEYLHRLSVAIGIEYILERN
jgi:hypothetical protein